MVGSAHPASTKQHPIVSKTVRNFYNMRVAFLVGVSKYDNLEELPACKKDVELIEALLKATNNYEQIKTIKEVTDSESIKSSLRGLVKQLSGNAIEEFFIYFSGHGLQRDGEMFLSCSDYSHNRSKSTSLLNSEVDELIRTISPELTVKVIDACQSGYSYIKDTSPWNNEIEDELKLKSINKFIFMASSQQRESSFANEHISFFTKAFFDAAISKNSEEDVYYRDIQSHVADAFKENRKQTPLFVSQITGLEIFAKSNDEIQSLKAKYKILIQKRNEEKTASERILEIIDEMESYYLKQEVVDEYLSYLEPSKLQLSLSDEICKNLYEIVNIDSVSLQDVGSARKIAQKVEQEKWAHRRF
jgi:hypothetical protein